MSLQQFCSLKFLVQPTSNRSTFGYFCSGQTMHSAPPSSVNIKIAASTTQNHRRHNSPGYGAAG